MDIKDIKDMYTSTGGEIKEFEKFEGKLEKGYNFSYEKRVTEIDVQLFGLISGDFSPIHFDESIALKTKFKGRVVHGMLTTSLISAALARLPGLVVIIETHFVYTAPVRIGDKVEVKGVVEEAEPERKRYKINLVCLANNRKVVEGWAKILIW
jgi:3-hydroxybutyryl-CoA dehydratase